MSNLLVLGCSYSDLDHHVKHGHRDNSYTIRIKNELGFNNLINLAVAGGSAMMVNRMLFQYMANPRFGLPDFVFIQWPYAHRNEYFIDDHNIKQAQLFTFTGEANGSIYSWTSDKGLDIKEFVDDEKYFVVNNSQWTSTNHSVDGKRLNAHLRLSADMSQQLINLYKEVHIAESYLDKLKIPYAYVESEIKVGYNNGLLSQEHHNLEAYSYAKLLCHKKFLIPNVGIQLDSPTYANDNYKDGHPGATSHKRFAEAIIPKLKELIQ
mgnify:CR=1 FL=1